MTSLFSILLMLLDVVWFIVIAHIIMSWLINFNVLNRNQPLVWQIWTGLNRLLEPLYVSLVRALPDSLLALSVLRWLLAALVVVVPTTAMGATLPLLARLVEDRFGIDERKRSLGVLYASNTLGGALGAIASAYVILPALGLRTTTLAAALLSAFVGIAAVALGRRSPAAASADAGASASATSSDSSA